MSDQTLGAFIREQHQTWASRRTARQAADPEAAFTAGFWTALAWMSENPEKFAALEERAAAEGGEIYEEAS